MLTEPNVPRGVPSRLAGAAMPRLLVTLSFAACATTGAFPTGSYRFNGLDAQGDIRVFPALHAYATPEVRLDDYVTETVSPGRARIRAARTADLALVPEAIALALPGAIGARVDPLWKADFRVARAPLRARDRLLTAIRRGDNALLEATLRDVARAVGGEATLFTWITNLDGEPVTTLDAPGTIIEGPQGSIVIDLFEDPYLVEAEIGIALVTSDGHIIVRYADRARALLAPHHGPSRAGRALADALAAEVAKVWPDRLDPRRPQGPAPTLARPEPIPAAASDEVPFRRTSLTTGAALRATEP
jgi:putative intracellular protease/amidase